MTPRTLARMVHDATDGPTDQQRLAMYLRQPLSAVRCGLEAAEQLGWVRGYPGGWWLPWRTPC